MSNKYDKALLDAAKVAMRYLERSKPGTQGEKIYAKLVAAVSLHEFGDTHG